MDDLLRTVGGGAAPPRPRHEHPGAAQSLGRPISRACPRRASTTGAACRPSLPITSIPSGPGPGSPPSGAPPKARGSSFVSGWPSTPSTPARPEFVDEALRPTGQAPRGRSRPRARRPRKVATRGTERERAITLDWTRQRTCATSSAAPSTAASSRWTKASRLTEVAGSRASHALALVADEMRRRQAGDIVTYVVNRNINFTNVCIKHCTFCAFSRDHREEEGLLPSHRRGGAARRGSVGHGRHRGVHPGRAAPQARRLVLRRSLPRHQGGGARDAPARLLARGECSTGRPAPSLSDSGVPEDAQGGRARHAPRHVGGDPRPGGARRHRARPHHRRSVDRGHHLRARPGHPHHLDHHVRPRRDPRRTGSATWISCAASRSADGRVHRVRPPLPHPSRGAHVPAGPRAGRARGGHRASR